MWMYVILLAQLVATGFMAGLIWFVQLVHYPLYRRVGGHSFTAYEAGHLRRVSWVVMPAMGLELLTAVLAPWVLPPNADNAWGVDGLGRALAWVGLVMVIGLWVSTAVLSVPCHERLRNAYEESAVERLVVTNWVRTALWTARVFVAVALLVMAFQGMQADIDDLIKSSNDF